MAAFWNRKSSVDTGVEPQVEYQNSEGRKWLTLAVYIIAALIVSTGVVLGGRWVYHKVSDSSDNSQQESTNKINGSNPAPETPNNAPKSAANQTTNQKPGNSKSTQTPQPGALPSSGPENVIAIFVTTSLLAAGLHFVISLRQSA